MNFIGRISGVTLIELLTVLAVSSIVATLSVSGFSTLLSKARMDSAVNGLVHSLQMARQISRTMGTTVTVCKSMDGQNCDNGADWHDGWLLFANLDDDTPPQIDPDEVVLEVHESVRNLEISANRRAFVMRPFGRRSTNGTFTYCDGRGASHAQAVIVSYTGKPRKSISGAGGQPLSCADEV
jgi:type IV fimbrial biogenesis protein FimT